jgi:ABC-type Na+ efflux pump permease subunit
MKVLRAVFWKEWVEAKRDPRAWLLSLVVPVLFYPGAVWLGAGGATRGPLHVATGDAWLAARLGGVKGVEVVPRDGGARVDAEAVVAAKDPGFPADGTMEIDMEIRHGGWITEQRFGQALREVGERLAGERAWSAGMAPGDLRPIRIANGEGGLGGAAGGGGGVVQTAPGAGGGATPLVAYLLVFVLFTGCLAMAVDAGAGERERGGMEALLATPAAPSEIAGGKILFIMLTGLASVAASLLGLALAVWAGGGDAAMFSGVGAGPVLAAAWLLLPCAAMVASWLFACSLVARSAREAHAWISGVFLLVSLGLIWLTFGGGGETPWIAWTPLFGAAGAIARALDGQCAPAQWLAPWISSAAGALFGTWICARLLRRESVLRAL